MDEGERRTTTPDGPTKDEGEEDLDTTQPDKRAMANAGQIDSHISSPLHENGDSSGNPSNKEECKPICTDLNMSDLGKMDAGKKGTTAPDGQTKDTTQADIQIMSDAGQIDSGNTNAKCVLSSVNEYDSGIAKNKDECKQMREFGKESDSERVTCEICGHKCNTTLKVKCNVCFKSMCEVCSQNHTSENHTKDTKENVDDTSENLCEPCKYVKKQSKASKRCEDCDEVLCDSCILSHKAHKVTRSHVIVDIVVEMKSNSKKQCEPCTFKGVFDKEASFVCTDCEEYLCHDCKLVHKNLKLTRYHTVKEINLTAARKCEPCLENGTEEVAEKFCKVCQECLCGECFAIHRSMKATRDHKVCDIQEVPVHDNKNEEMCEPCKCSSKAEIATHFCSDCEELLCLLCMKHHQQLKATKLHVIITVDEYQRGKSRSLECVVCKEGGTSKKAVAFCIDCDPPELMCSECTNHHKTMKATRKHRIENSLEKYRHEEEEKNEADVANIEDSRLRSVQTSQMNLFQPGKPRANDKPKADSIHLSWNTPQNFYDAYQYQIRYKTTAPSDKWKFYEEMYKKSSVILKNLQSNTTFVFQVRMVNHEEEGPYGDPSDEITTQQSAANRLIEFSHILTNNEGILEKRKLPLVENKRARNSNVKTRRFDLGNPSKTPCKEKTILLVGATGSGKSTLVDGFINYILGVNWDDPFRFTLVDLEEEEMGIIQNQAISQTHWITTYCVNPINGSRLDYKLNIIDTPGFGDTRGFERDQKIIDQIRHLFSATDETGVVFLDSVCFLAKAPDARLTPSQKYIFNAILSLFGQDIADNINILITFADGKAPPVLAALKEAKLPHDEYFPFNNSGLYADNAGPDMSSLSPMFWEMGYKSFSAFFEHLKSMQTKSLKQTKEVLTKRHQLEVTIENLSPLVSNGLNKVEELREEIRILEQHKLEIEANKNFVYTVTETKQVKKDLPIGQHITNCLNCNVSCHKECRIPKDEDKHSCWAMDSGGNCTQCIENCHWSQHANTPYIFEYEQEEKTKNYAEKEEKYRSAHGEKMTHEKVVLRMGDELEEMEIKILLLMSKVTECNNVLKQIALRPNPLSIKEHIDLLIEGEKLEKRQGFQQRVSVLQEFRKKANIGEDVTRFRQSLVDARSHSTFQAKRKEKSQGRKGKNIFGFLFK